MDSATRAFTQQLLAENEERERLGNLLLSLAATMQQVTEQEGLNLGLPPLANGCNVPMVQQMIGQLRERLAQRPAAQPPPGPKAEPAHVSPPPAALSKRAQRASSRASGAA